MRAITYILITLLVLIQYPLWFGKGGWLKVWDMERKVEQQKNKNMELANRNAALEGEVKDLRTAIEERARFELGMVKPDEIFVQVIPKSSPPPAAAAPSVSNTRHTRP